MPWTAALWSLAVEALAVGACQALAALDAALLPRRVLWGCESNGSYHSGPRPPAAPVVPSLQQP